ncbi:hypothetical protein KC19_8G189500 [Ceratodon purpureus]|uniref:Origin recognition complex subunit 2 n=1 Tax=Ceratodon purpureus TaxID=3225 RepID=A0A8T0H4U8_CERPU|nr:hypothetical protein KC19_8G189500 [Ceratodon purpureus]
MDGRRGVKRACSDDDEPEYTPKKKRGRPRKSLAAEQTPERSVAAEQTPKRGRGRPPGSRKSLAAELSPEKSNVGEQTPAKTPKAVNFLDLEENVGATPQSYFRVKEGSGVGKRLANRIADIGIVEEQDLRDAIAKLSPKHEKEQAALLESYRTFYHKWYFQLRCGFGLLMYGFGSKKKLLEDFATSELRDGAAVVVNGYLSNVNIKHVVYTVVNTLWEARKKGKASNKAKQDSPVSSNSLVDLLGSLTDDDDDSTHIYVIIHNIDGPGLRDDDVQQTLANLASSKHVRLVASIDNINAPILWDKQMARNQFKWLWLHTPTYAAYKVEGACVPLLLAAGAATKSARSAILVLRSLTPNAQSVFRVLGEFQISHPEDQGLPLNRLYTACREQFLVSSEVTLRAHLTEFKDHELLKFRRGVDGQDCLYIPLPNEALSKLLEDITS